MTMTTTAALMIGSGSLNGIAAQVSLPSMSTPSLLHRRTPGRAGARLFGTRHRLVDDMLEEVGPGRAIGRRRHRFARLCQLPVTGLVERGPNAAYLRHPGVEIAGRHRLGDKPHLGKAVTAEICRKAGIFAGLVGEQVEVGRHAAHRVDLAAELRDEEG